MGGINIDSFTKMSVVDALKFIESVKLTDREMMIAGQVLKEIKERLTFLSSVGLEYLTLARSAGSLQAARARGYALPRR